jgi:ribosome-binding factor A
LHFHYDSSIEHGIEMSRLIDQAVDSDRSSDRNDQADETK